MVGFTTRSEVRDGIPVLAFAGDLDVATRRAARDALQGVLAAGTGPLVLDLTDLGFLDSTGLTVLINTHNEARRAGRPFAIVVPAGAPRRTLELSGLDEELRLAESFAGANEALAASSP